MSLLTKKITAAKADLRGQAERIRKQIAVFGDPRIKQAWMMINPSLRKDAHVYMSESRVVIMVPLRKLKSFKDPKLVGLLERFTEADWVASTYDSTWGDAPNREYTFRLFPVEVRIDATVRSDSKSCRIVVTGTKVRTYEEPIKEIVCD